MLRLLVAVATVPLLAYSSWASDGSSTYCKRLAGVPDTLKASALAFQAACQTAVPPDPSSLGSEAIAGAIAALSGEPEARRCHELRRQALEDFLEGLIEAHQAHAIRQVMPLALEALRHLTEKNLLPVPAVCTYSEPLPTILRELLAEDHQQVDRAQHRVSVLTSLVREHAPERATITDARIRLNVTRLARMLDTTRAARMLPPKRGEKGL